MSHRVLVVVGTRPEAVKMAPVYYALAAIHGPTPVIVSTGQHTDQLCSPQGAFDLTPDYELRK
jgi:UDP-N-acetylglucosamine 2-epimerase (non-hydrolysing)